MSAPTDDKPSVVNSDMSDHDRIIRIDALLCLLVGGIVSHPLATTMIPPVELAQLRTFVEQR